MQIGNRIQAFEWYHFQRPRVTSNLDFFVYKVVLRLIAVKMEGTDITGIALTLLLYLQIFPIYVCLLRGCKCECDDVNLWSRVTWPVRFRSISR